MADPLRLEIVVRGDVAAGKTHIARALCELLLEDGFKVTVIEENPEPPFQSDWPARKVLKAIGPTREVAIRTETVRVKAKRTKT